MFYCHRLLDSAMCLCLGVGVASVSSLDVSVIYSVSVSAWPRVFWLGIGSVSKYLHWSCLIVDVSRLDVKRRRSALESPLPNYKLIAYL